ncbi:Integrase, catalytic core [Gossypium australe]|uniref:Integrase, catalytic core n=1 Tax=Gossypium australe TaxID=47621 RepID=A0A5B6V938_9ROSI|nr:Integrase, catalytic core [Gossypium australe]
MNVMGDLKRKISTRIPRNTENNPKREGMEYVKVIMLCSNKLKQDEVEFASFLNLFKSLNDNLPLVELIEKVPKYTIYLKEIMSRLRKIKRGEQANLDASCSIGDIHFSKARCDLGVSINLMPLLIYGKLRLGELKNTHITLHLDDRSSIRPKRVLEDVLVKVHNFIILVDFIILDFEEDCEIPILLGRPFLATSRSIINLGMKQSRCHKTDPPYWDTTHRFKKSSNQAR